jgi:hypothetical protein
MDGGSGINVLYVSTLDEMGIPRSALRPSTAPFHGVTPRIDALPLGQIDLPVTFGDVQNFRIETLTFKVVGFSGTYHAILGRPTYAKFMVVPNYTYLKLKIPGPRGIITVGPTYLSYGPPWAHYLGGYQDRLLGRPLGLLDLHCTAPTGMKHKDYEGEVLEWEAVQAPHCIEDS